MSFSNYLEREVLDHIFLRTNGFPQPAGIYVALSTNDPGEDGSGMQEPQGNGYARVQHASWGRDANTVMNDAAIEFPSSVGPWASGAEITHFAIFDAESGGNFLLKGPVTPAQQVTEPGQTVLFNATELKVTLE